MVSSVYHELARAARVGEPVALAIITSVKGSSPQKLGAKALFLADHRMHGTLGGGCLEAEVQRLALAALKDARPKTFDLLLDHDFGWDDGLVCGGKVSGVVLPNAQSVGETFWHELALRESTQHWGVKRDFTIARISSDDIARCEGGGSLKGEAADDWMYTEIISSPCVLWIAGSGHIAQAVAPLALQLDFSVTVFDDRPELANHRFFPAEIVLRTGPWGELCMAPFPQSPTLGLIVTRGHKHDAFVLETWIHRPFAFLGMIGSARKARTVKEHFLANRLATLEEIERVACPVGVRVRSRSVMEIAVDILAQYIDQRAAVLAAAGAQQPAKFDVTL